MLKRRVRPKKLSKHDWLCLSLAKLHYGLNRLVFLGAKLGSVWNAPRGEGPPIPDVMIAHKSYTKPMWTVYEVKASKSDFNSDLNAGKYLKYMPYCSRLYFATPAGLVKKNEVPESCGLVTWSEKIKTWSTAKRAGVRNGGPDMKAMQALMFHGAYAGEVVRDLENSIRMLKNEDYRNQSIDLSEKMREDLHKLKDARSQISSAKACIGRAFNINQWNLLPLNALVQEACRQKKSGMSHMEKSALDVAAKLLNFARLDLYGQDKKVIPGSLANAMMDLMHMADGKIPTD